MPLYEYACRACGENFERRLRYEERLIAQSCPRCSASDSSLRISAAAVLAGHTSQSSAPTCPTTGAPCGCGRAH